MIRLRQLCSRRAEQCAWPEPGAPRRSLRCNGSVDRCSAPLLPCKDPGELRVPQRAPATAREGSGWRRLRRRGRWLCSVSGPPRDMAGHGSTCECMAAAIHEAKDRIPRNPEHEMLACKYQSATLVHYRLKLQVEIYLCNHRDIYDVSGAVTCISINEYMHFIY